MRSFVSLAIVTVFVLCMATFALARGAPTRQKAFTAHAVVSAHVAPTVANVAPMTLGYDVIENMSTAYPRPRLASVNQYIATAERGSRSTTVAEHKIQSASTYCLARSGPQPASVLLI
jgi:hypothetical protein